MRPLLRYGCEKLASGIRPRGSVILRATGRAVYTWYDFGTAVPDTCGKNDTSSVIGEENENAKILFGNRTNKKK